MGNNCFRPSNGNSSPGPSATSSASTWKPSNASSSLFDPSTTTCSGASSGDRMKQQASRIVEAPYVKVFSFEELKAATRNFKQDMLIGEGGFGNVYKGWVDEANLNPSKPGVGIMVAVKKLKPESLQGIEEWQNEVHFLGSLVHPNLVRLLGYCWEDKELLLVYEHMQKGSLEHHIFRRAFQPLPWNIRLKVAIDAARGLAFLHSLDRQIIYRDFKASNVLLDSNYNAKLSDFGLARHGPSGANTHVTTQLKGTYGYAAPEYIATGHLYVHSDVYAFGVVLLEILTGLRAMDSNRPVGQQRLADWGKPLLSDRRNLKKLMDRRLEGKYSSKAAFHAALLTEKCLSDNPRSRPSMKEVVEELERIVLL